MTAATPPAADATAKYEMVVGLEVHVQLRTRTKAFCNCSTDFGAAPNVNTSLLTFNANASGPFVPPGAVGTAPPATLAATLASTPARAARAHERAVAAPPGARVLAVALLVAHRRAAAPLGERFRDGQRAGHRDEDEQRKNDDPQPVHVYATVSRTTSSSVVTPFRILCSPDSRSVIIPSSMARLRSSRAEAPIRISSRISSVTSITS